MPDFAGKPTIPAGGGGCQENPRQNSSVGGDTPEKVDAVPPYGGKYQTPIPAGVQRQVFQSIPLTGENTANFNSSVAVRTKFVVYYQ